MPDEPENPVLMQLREMRSELQGVRSKLEEHDRRFDRIDRRFDDFQLLANHALGLVTANQIKTRDLEADQQESRARQRRIEDRHAEIERRLGRIEETTETRARTVSCPLWPKPPTKPSRR